MNTTNGKQYVGQYVTLDGKRAIVTGGRLRFATIAQIPSGLSVEFAWPTVAYVVEQRGGRFQSA